MTRRIFRAAMTVALAVLLAAMTLIVGVLHGYFQSRTAADLNQLAAAAARGAETDGLDYFDGLRVSSRLTWVAEDGTVLYDNWQDAAEMENHSGREEVVQAQAQGRGTAERWSDTLAQ